MSETQKRGIWTRITEWWNSDFDIFPPSINIRNKIAATVVFQATIFAVLFTTIFFLFFTSFLDEQMQTREVITEEQANSFRTSFLKTALITLLCVYAFSYPLSIFISHFEAGPIIKLKKATERVAKGDLSTDMKIMSGGEIRDLFISFKHMTHSLKSSQERLKKSIDLKTQFVNQIAHDMRTPLVPIIGLLPLLRDELKKGDSEDNREMMDKIQANVRYLLSLVNDTVNIAKLDSGKLDVKMDPQNMRTIVDEVIENNSVVFEQEGVKAVNNVPADLPHVRGDKVRILELFENIIGNARKFMDKEKVLTFDAEVRDNIIIASMKDTGQGIPRKDLGRVFDEFEKLDESRHLRSSGLGLSICKRIIKVHGGKIWAESDGPGKGATIRFALHMYKKGDTEKKYLF